MKIIRAVTSSKSLVFFIDTLPELMKRGYEVNVVSSKGPEIDAVELSGVQVNIVEMERRISPVKDMKSLFHLVRLFRHLKPTMVHSMTPKAGLLCMMAAWLVRVPVRVHTFTGLVFPSVTGPKRGILMLTDWVTCACATHIIPEGEGVKRDLLNNNITNKDIRVLGYGNVRGIDLEHFSLNREVVAASYALRQEDVFTFISVGRLVGDKGINELVAAFKRLNKEIPKTRLILVGSYEHDLDPLEDKTINEINNNPAIEAVGQQSDVRPWFAAADCAVLASYREGFPNVVIEAGAMGLPQIVTDINGANEIIIQDENGAIVPPKNSDALLVEMKRMVQDEAWRNMLAANARGMIASRYEQSYVHKCLYDFYDQILKDY